MPSPSFDYQIGDTAFTWDLNTLMDRLTGQNGHNIGDAFAAGGQIAGAATESVVAPITDAIEAWLPRVVIILLALVFIAGALMMLGNQAGLTNGLRSMAT